MTLFSSTQLFSEGLSELDCQLLFITLVGTCLVSDVNASQLLNKFLLDTAFDDTSVVTPLGAQPTEELQEVGESIDPFLQPPSLEEETLAVSTNDEEFLPASTSSTEETLSVSITDEDETSPVSSLAEDDILLVPSTNDGETSPVSSSVYEDIFLLQESQMSQLTSDRKEPFGGSAVTRKFCYHLVSQSDKVGPCDYLSNKGYSDTSPEAQSLTWCAMLSVLLHLYRYKNGVYDCSSMVNGAAFLDKIDGCIYHLVLGLKPVYFRCCRTLDEFNEVIDEFSSDRLIEAVFDSFPSHCRFDYPLDKLCSSDDLFDFDFTELMVVFEEVICDNGWDREAYELLNNLSFDESDDESDDT